MTTHDLMHEAACYPVVALRECPAWQLDTVPVYEGVRS